MNRMVSENAAERKLAGDERHRSYRTFNALMAVALLGGVTLALLSVRFRDVLPKPLMACSSMVLFGRPCPMCGLTRGIYAVLQGKLAQAQAYNPLALPAAILIVAELAYRTGLGLVSIAPGRLGRLSRADVKIHAILVILYLLYALWFFVARV